MGIQLALCLYVSQLKLFTDKKYPHRKTARSISLRGANHIVLKTDRPILRKHIGLIRALIHETQSRYGVKLRALAATSVVAPITTKRDQSSVERYVARNPIKAGIWSAIDMFVLVDGVLQP